MPSYQLQIRQVVDYPRCRIYRQFIQTLIADRSIRTDGGTGLYYYTVLCSYVNFRTSYQRIEGISYTVFPGEWFCGLKKLAGQFRTRTQQQALGILDDLQARGLIHYTLLGRGRVIKYQILDWNRHNTVLDYNCPCQKDTGFFFLPIATAAELVSSGRCSEMDAVLDLWLSTVYNDGQIQGSEIGPVVYLRNGTGSPLVNSSELAQRWGVSKSTAWRLLKKLDELGYISLLSFPGRKGSVIYLRGYLSTMFQISDVLVDKQEAALALDIYLRLPDTPDTKKQPAAGSPEPRRRIRVAKGVSCVSKAQALVMLAKLAEILVPQGFSCFQCRKTVYKLYPLSACKGERVRDESSIPDIRFGLSVHCGRARPVYAFELTLQPLQKTRNGGFRHE